MRIIPVVYAIVLVHSAINLPKQSLLLLQRPQKSEPSLLRYNPFKVAVDIGHNDVSRAELDKQLLDKLERRVSLDCQRGLTLGVNNIISPF